MRQVLVPCRILRARSTEAAASRLPETVHCGAEGVHGGRGRLRRHPTPAKWRHDLIDTSEPVAPLKKAQEVKEFFAKQDNQDGRRVQKSMLVYDVDNNIHNIEPDSGKKDLCCLSHALLKSIQQGTQCQNRHGH